MRPTPSVLTAGGSKTTNSFSRSIMDGHTTPDSVSTAKAPSEHEISDVEIAELAASAVDLGLAPDSELTGAIAAAGVLGTELPENAREDIIEAINEGTAATQSLETIEPLFAPGDVVELRAIHLGSGAKSLCGRLAVPAERSALIEFIRSQNGRSNLYFGVNPRDPSLAGTQRAGRAADVRARRTVFLDFDNKDAPRDDPQWAKTIEALKALKPALVLESGNGAHVHIAIHEIGEGNLQSSARPLAAAMKALGSDNVSDAPRIARLPYTLNIPTEKKRAAGAALKIATPRDIPAPTSPPSGPPTAETVCSSLIEVAHGLGRQSDGDQEREPLDRSVPARRTRPAPSPEILLTAVQELPNNGPFDERQDWVAVAYAIKGAADGAGCGDVGREAWLEFCQRWHKEPAAGVAEEAWNSLKESRTGWELLLEKIDELNPEGAKHVRYSEATLEFPAVAVEDSSKKLTLAPASVGDPRQIPPRRWLYGRSVIAGHLSMTVAPGGTGKSALIMAEAVAMATGKNLLELEKPRRPLRVWYHNAEDPQDEQVRRLAAAMSNYGLSDADLGQNLYLSSGREFQLSLATHGRHGAEITQGIETRLCDLISCISCDVLVLDPLGAVHSVSENSNEDANLVMGLLRRIADRTNTAIILVHHVGKLAAANMDAVGAGASRGATAWVDGARLVRQLITMSKTEALELKIPEEDRRSFIRIENGKLNLVRHSAGRWIRLKGVNLGNGADLWPEGDTVQTVQHWLPPEPIKASVSELEKVQSAVQRADIPPRLDQQATDWIGFVVADALALDVGVRSRSKQARTVEQQQNRKLINSWVRDWVEIGALEVYQHSDSAGRPRDHVRTGKAADLLSVHKAWPSEHPS